MTTVVALFSALATLIAFNPVAFAQRAPLPDDTYPAAATPASSGGSHVWVVLGHKPASSTSRRGPTCVAAANELDSEAPEVLCRPYAGCGSRLRVA
jgi:hypothetical protein